jgi:hypothetical protein
VVYDRFGDFAGFRLRDEEGRECRRDEDDPAPWVERLILRRRAV